MRKLVLFFILLACPALAAEKPSAIAPYINAETPYGQGTMSRLMIKAYDAVLWTDAAKWSLNVPFALTLHYRMGFDKKDLVQRSVKEIQHASALSKKQGASYAKQLSAIFPAVKSGDEITAFFVPEKGIKFFYNNQPSGEITDLTFAKRFVGIWLAPTTTEPSLRKALLGGK